MKADSGVSSFTSDNLQIVSRSEARERGLKRYFTGIPCKRGHVCERITSCKKCLMCHAERMKKWHHANKDEARRRSRVYRENNRDLIAKSSREWYEKNREAVIKRSTDRIKSDRKKHAQYVRAWALKNPYKVSAARQKRRATLRSAEGSHTPEDLMKIFHSQFGRCAACQISLASACPHVDHKTPLSRGGSNGPENLQYLCASCNLKKGTMTNAEFMRARLTADTAAAT